jgi:hypothetical protein
MMHRTITHETRTLSWYSYFPAFESITLFVGGLEEVCL